MEKREMQLNTFRDYLNLKQFQKKKLENKTFNFNVC